MSHGSLMSGCSGGRGLTQPVVQGWAATEEWRETEGDRAPVLKSHSSKDAMSHHAHKAQCAVQQGSCPHRVILGATVLTRMRPAGLGAREQHPSQLAAL